MSELIRKWQREITERFSGGLLLLARNRDIFVARDSLFYPPISCYPAIIQAPTEKELERDEDGPEKWPGYYGRSKGLQAAELSATIFFHFFVTALSSEQHLFLISDFGVLFLLLFSLISLTPKSYIKRCFLHYQVTASLFLLNFLSIFWMPWPFSTRR